VLVSSKDRRVIEHDVYFEDSDHHRMGNAGLHKRLYPREGESVEESW
jgi:hypothetical protein